MSITQEPTPLERAPSRWATEPFVMGTPAQFARLREWLPAVGYTEPAVCSAANIPWLGRMLSLESPRRTVFKAPDDPQSLLVLLFLDGEHVPWTTVRRVLSANELTTLTDLGLLQPSIRNADECVGTVALFPSENLYVISDRLKAAEAIGEGSPPDVVYTPMTAETHQFIAMMPRVPCADYLEMCAGTGIAALLAAKQFARNAYSADITERSTRFARFNAALNDLPNFEAVQGDLYEPVAGKQFDMISAHPPYVPAESTEMVFRDGGADGEQITRRIVAGLPEYLKPGGLFFLDCMLTDRTSDATEQRLRRMLGPDEDEFDVVVFRSGITEAKQYQANQLAEGRLTPDALMRQREFFKWAGIEHLVGVQVIMQRRAQRRAVVTRHHTISEHTSAEDLLWLVRYASETVEWGPDETRRLLDLPLRAIPTTEMRVRSVLVDGTWTTVATTVGTLKPFSVEAPCPSWFPGLLSRCDGVATAREHLARLRADGVVPSSTTDDNFAQLIRELADVPLLEVSEFPLPRTARGEDLKKSMNKT